MSQAIITKLGKKGAIYIPKQISERLGLREGDKVLMKVDDNKLIFEFIQDPLSLALKIKKWSRTTVEEFEKESEADQNALSGN
ncbi:MAG: AbrB/MazE/SpoVT family DNA-binding domain-containing protein [Candidatus Methanomethyliaceae archaeon]|nr:AbrB/MazE/SpoVT family DNA-binding domain-containing protein [Candidatus Methanomethyliaceae archaeon]